MNTQIAKELATLAPFPQSTEHTEHRMNIAARKCYEAFTKNEDGTIAPFTWLPVTPDIEEYLNTEEAKKTYTKLRVYDYQLNRFFIIGADQVSVLQGERLWVMKQINDAIAVNFPTITATDRITG
jgi:hypothetical protein